MFEGIGNAQNSIRCDVEVNALMNKRNHLPKTTQPLGRTVLLPNCALTSAAFQHPPALQLSSTGTECSVPVYLLASILPKSQLPVPHLSITIVNRWDLSSGCIRSRKLGVPIAGTRKDGQQCSKSLLDSRNSGNTDTDFQLCCQWISQGLGYPGSAAGLSRFRSQHTFSESMQ